MNARRSFAVLLVFAVIIGTAPAGLLAQGTVSLSGTAKNEAKKPYGVYTARARDLRLGVVGGMTNLDTAAHFALGNLAPASYVIELLDRDGKIVCTEGPFDMTRDTTKDDIVISCGKVPAAWWLLGAAAAAGITAGIVSTGPASASQ